MKRKLHILLAVGIGLMASVGWLHATIVTPKDGAELLKDVAAANAGDTIKLAERHYVLDKQLVINKPIVLLGSTTNEEGAPSSIISANPLVEWPKKPNTTELQNSTANLISIQGDESGTVTLENIKVTESLASGIHAQSKMTTVLKNVHSFKNSNAGLLVVSKVEATGLETFGNGWGGVNVDKGSPAYDINFKFDGASRFHEPYQIWTEQTTTENLVTSPERYKWETYTIQESGTEKAKKYWVQSELNMDYVAQFPRNDKLKAGYTFVYAGGASINIQQSSNDGFITINSEGKTLLELPEKCNPVIFGGSKEALDGNTNITMESGRVYALFGGGYNASVKDVALTVNGGTVKQYLVGGGFGPNSSKDNATSADATSADATAVTMNVKGATVGYLISGGMEFSKVTSTQVELDGATIFHALGGGFAPVGFSQSIAQTFENSLNRVDSTKFTMTGGVVKSEIMLGGGFSFSYAKKVTAVLSGVTFNGGLYGIGFNGFSDEVTATVNGCTFNKVNPDYNTIAAMVRGKAGNVSMTFDENCKFDSQYECYLGADRDNEYNPAPMAENATFVFKGSSTPIVKVSEGMQDVTITGAKVNVAPFLQQLSSNTYVKDFTIPANKTWTFNDGLAMSSGVTLTKTGTLEYGNSFEANVATADELKAAVALGADVINLADATYELSETLALTKSVILQGADSAKCIIKGAVELSSDEAADVTLSGLRFDYSPTKITKTDSCMPLIGIKGKANLIVENCRFNNQTAGYGNYNTKKPGRELQHVFYTAPDATGELMVNNSVINLNADHQTAVFIDGVMENVSLSNVKVNGDQVDGSHQIGVFIYHEKTPVTLDNTTVLLNNHYCVYSKYAGNQTITIKNSSFLSGYGAVYSLGSENTIINISNECTLTGKTKNNGPSDSFGALILQASNNKVTIEDSYIGTLFAADQTALMTPILISRNTYSLGGVDKYAEKDTIIIKGRSIIRSMSNEKNPFLINYGINMDPSIDKHSVIIEGGGVQFKDQNDKDCVIVNALDGTFRNAAISLFYAIDGLEVYDKEDSHYSVANRGNEVAVPDTLASAAIRSLNASKDLFMKVDTDTGSKYAIPDSVVINCKDAYLVTGKNAAIVLSDSLSNIKPVFWLQQDTTVTDANMFTTVAVGNNRVKVVTNTSWDNTNNANRSVEIAANVTLTINVAMPLDTVFMAEGAQLVANAAVTAKAVQLAYGVEKTWKAFGFPFEIGKIVGLNGSTDVKTVASSAEKGIWTAGIAADAPTFTVTAANATPAASCIIAADKDSTILVTTTGSTLISLSSQPEPSAPIVTKAGTENFKIVSNPNVYSIELTQTAYVLSEDGKTFDRMVNPTISAFQSFVLADEVTTGTLRSLRVDDTPTGNEIVPTDGYYVQTGKGFITIRTSEPVQVVVVDMLGRVYYNARINDGAQINLPAGIYAVNRQKVIVK